MYVYVSFLSKWDELLPLLASLKVHWKWNKDKMNCAVALHKKWMSWNEMNRSKQRVEKHTVRLYKLKYLLLINFTSIITIVLHVLNGSPFSMPLPPSLLLLPSFIARIIIAINVPWVLERIVAIVMIKTYIMSANRLLPTIQIAISVCLCSCVCLNVVIFVRHLILISTATTATILHLCEWNNSWTIVSDILQYTFHFIYCILFYFESHFIFTILFLFITDSQ